MTQRADQPAGVNEQTAITLRVSPAAMQNLRWAAAAINHFRPELQATPEKILEGMVEQFGNRLTVETFIQGATQALRFARESAGQIHQLRQGVSQAASAARDLLGGRG